MFYPFKFECVREKKSRKQINLCGNSCSQITDEGLEGLAEGLKGLKSMKEFRLQMSL